MADRKNIGLHRNNRCRNARRSAPSPGGGGPGWGLPAFPPVPNKQPAQVGHSWLTTKYRAASQQPLPKCPPIRSLPQWGRAGVGFAGFPAGAKQTARASRLFMTDHKIVGLHRNNRYRNARRSAPSPGGGGPGWGLPDFPPMPNKQPAQVGHSWLTAKISGCIATTVAETPADPPPPLQGEARSGGGLGRG